MGDAQPQQERKGWLQTVADLNAYGARLKEELLKEKPWLQLVTWNNHKTLFVFLLSVWVHNLRQ